MSSYKIGTGHNVPEISLNDIVPQPMTTGIQAVQREYAISGSVYEHGAFIVFLFEVLEDSTDYQALLTQFGLSAALTAEVTIYAQNWDFTWVRRNGLAVRPEVGRDVQRQNYFLRNVEILVKNLTVAI